MLAMFYSIQWPLKLPRKVSPRLRSRGLYIHTKLVCVRFRGSPDARRWLAPIVSDAIDPELTSPRTSGAIKGK